MGLMYNSCGASAPSWLEDGGESVVERSAPPAPGQGCDTGPVGMLVAILGSVLTQDVQVFFKSCSEVLRSKTSS